MTEKIRSIFTDLERVRENLLALSDDIWLSIDHNDNEALEKGVKFKADYNEKVAAFDRLATELSHLVQQFTQVRIDRIEEMQAESRNGGTNTRQIAELDKSVPHNLHESFTFKRPYGFILKDRAFQKLLTWREVYTLTCLTLAQENPKLFTNLPTNSAFISRRGNPTFSLQATDLRTPIHITNGIYAEGNLSANHIRDVIVKLLDLFEMPIEAMRIFLREDRGFQEGWIQ